MSIASAIQNAQQKVTNAYIAVNSKGGTLPATQNLSNLPNAISSIPTGSFPAGTLSITQNGTYDITNYASADVNVSGGGGVGITREVSANGVYQIPASSFTFSLPSNATDVGNYAIYYAFQNCTGLTSVDLSSLTTVSGSYAMNSTFSGCTGLTSVNFNNLQTIGADTSSTNYGQFSNCFYSCNNLTSITFPKLEKIYCTGGTSTSYGTFANNNKVQKMYFPKLDMITYGTGASSSNQNACKNVFNGCSSLIELHFGAANQSAIQASSGYSTAWGRGAGNVTIYFDL